VDTVKMNKYPLRLEPRLVGGQTHEWALAEHTSKGFIYVPQRLKQACDKGDPIYI